MAPSRRKESIGQLVTELECAFHDDPEQIPGDDEMMLDHLGPQESLDLGHARLRSECWAGPPHNALRSARPQRQRTPLHLARPSAAAEARFTSGQGEFLD